MYILVVVAGALFMIKGKIGAGDYVAYLLFVSTLMTSIRRIVEFTEQFQRGMTGIERFCEIMDVEPEKDVDGAVDIENIVGEIEFKNVNHSYVEGAEVLNNVNFKISAGKKFALVGPSGGGKTTICHLLPHFYSISSGEILIDGKNIDGFTRASLRQNIGIVQQDVYLFNASIKENILYGRPDATDEEIVEAAKRANIHGFVSKLADGYDTIIGERGVKLSGGQKQRLSIARIFLKNPPMLILDEATSALDNTTEILIQSALDELCKGRTTIVVAHRLSTIKNADEIAVVSDGKITEQGTHAELMQLNGLYAELYSKQFREDE
jgi:ATP-binding cassette subfamily B protein